MSNNLPLKGRAAVTKAQKPGAYGRRIIRTFIKNGREYQLHATKGWRSYQVVK